VIEELNRNSRKFQRLKTKLNPHHIQRVRSYFAGNGLLALQRQITACHTKK